MLRRLPVHPNPEQIHRQAKELLRAIHAGETSAIAEVREQHPEVIDPTSAKLADAQLVLARSYQASSWTRLIHAVQLADAIWRDDLDLVRRLVTRNPALIHEHVLIRTDSNWGPPMTYAANLGRDRIIRFLHDEGARDLESAAGRAALQGKVDTVHMIYELAGKPSLEKLTLAGPAYTLSVEGTAVLLTLGARIVGPNGVDHNTMEHLGFTCPSMRNSKSFRLRSVAGLPTPSITDAGTVTRFELMRMMSPASTSPNAFDAEAGVGVGLGSCGSLITSEVRAVRAARFAARLDRVVAGEGLCCGALPC